MSDINLLLGKKIPALINWQAAVTYCFPVGIGMRRAYYRFGYDLCGTKPDIAMIGAIVNRATATQAKASRHTTRYSPAAEDNELCGTEPDIATLGSLVAVSSVLEAKRQNYTNDYKTAAESAQEAGEWPGRATLGNATEINAGAGVKVANYGVDYIYCGTRQSQS